MTEGTGNFGRSLEREKKRQTPEEYVPGILDSPFSQAAGGWGGEAVAVLVQALGCAAQCGVVSGAPHRWSRVEGKKLGQKGSTRFSRAF